MQDFDQNFGRRAHSVLEHRDEREMSITQRERQLWERQERMYEREMARWDQERQYWHQREAMLLQHISKLHTGLLTLAELQTKQLPAPEGWRSLSLSPSLSPPHGPV